MQIVRNEQLEKQIIASAIVSEKALDELAHRVRETDFTIEPLAKICTELHKCAQKGYKPEASLIAGRLGNEYFDIFGQLMTTVSTSNDIKDLVRKLKEVTQAREITSKAYNIVAMSQDIIDHKDFSEHAMAEFSNLAIEHTEGKLSHISDSFSDVINIFGIPAVFLSDFSLAQTSYPSMIGITTSRRIMSGLESIMAISRAFSPFKAATIA